MGHGRRIHRLRLTAPSGGAARCRPRTGESSTIRAVLRIGIIGLGYWGPNYARVVTELPGAQLAWVCDASEAALESVSARYPARATTDPDELFAADDVDAVIVATPTSTHAALSIRALGAGKHVLSEKPLAASVSDCDDVIAAAEDADRVLFVGHTFIFNPAVRQMRELVESGEIGKLLYCHAARTGLGPIRQDVNALWDLAPHDLAIIFHLFGREPVSVTATGQAFLREGVEDVVFAQPSLRGRRDRRRSRLLAGSVQGAARDRGRRLAHGGLRRRRDGREAEDLRPRRELRGRVRVGEGDGVRRVPSARPRRRDPHPEGRRARAAEGAGRSASSSAA